jgi:Phosphodiester glycosidase
MGHLASSSTASAPARVDDLLRLTLADGLVTTLHVARWDLSRTRVRIARLQTQHRLIDWCASSGCADALVGGFYTRPAGLPLGELRLNGLPVEHVPFAAPWHTTRASLHVAGATVRIDRRDELPADAPGDLLQAGPLLVRNGRIAYRDGVDSEGFSAAAQQFDSDITSERHPRAAIGVGRGSLIAAVADGRSHEDAGLTLGELARAMADLGARAAMNLDGGGSASLVCDGHLRNRPREQHGMELAGGRAVTTVIAFDAA